MKKLFKRILVSVLVLLFLSIPVFSFAADGDIETPINVSITTASTEVTLGASQKCRSYVLQARGTDIVYIYKTKVDADADQNRWTIKSGASISIRAVITTQGSTICWAKSAAGAEVLEIALTNDY